MNRKQGSEGRTEVVRGLVSVIIPTRNSARTIQSCLDSINNQSHSNIETILVDALSTDGTPQISERLGARVISLDSERARAKNEGIAHSHGEFVLFVDSDMVLEKNVVSECIEACENAENIAGVVIPERSVGDSFWVKVRDFERGLYADSKIESARFFKRVPVIAVEGFDEEFVFFEESTLPQRIENLGLSVSTRISSFILHDESNFDLRSWARKKKYYFSTAKAYQQKYPNGGSQLSVSYRLSLLTSNGKWKTLLRHPILSSGLFILKSIELLASRSLI